MLEKEIADSDHEGGLFFLCNDARKVVPFEKYYAVPKTGLFQ